MGHFLFQSVFYLSVVFKIPYLSIFVQFLQLQEEERGSQSVNGKPTQSPCLFNLIAYSSKAGYRNNRIQFKDSPHCCSYNNYLI